MSVAYINMKHSPYIQLRQKRIQKMAFSGTNVWGNTYKQNKDKSCAPFGSRHNFGESTGPSSLPAFSNQDQNSNNFNWTGHQNNTFGGSSTSGNSSNSSSSMGSSSDLDKRVD